MSKQEPTDDFGSSRRTAQLRKLSPTLNAESLPVAQRASAVSTVYFSRNELLEIMNIYGRKVAKGEWRDYALDFTPTRAIFSVFRRTSEVPLFRIEKDPGLRPRQGCYAVIAATGHILKRGHDLHRVLAALDDRPKLVLV